MVDISIIYSLNPKRYTLYAKLLPRGVIGNTLASGASISGSSPAGAAKYKKSSAASGGFFFAQDGEEPKGYGEIVPMLSG